MKVQIIIPVEVINSSLRSMTENCINSLAATEYKNYSVLVIANKYPFESNGVKTIFNETSKRVTGSWNQGIKNEIADIYVLANNDIVFYDEWLMPIVGNLISDIRIAFTSPQIIDRPKDMEYLNNRLGRSGFMNGGITGCCFAFRKDVIDDIGLFDERLDPFYSDYEMWERAKSRGYKVGISKGSYISHLGSKSCKAILGKNIEEERNRCRRIYESIRPKPKSQRIRTTR